MVRCGINYPARASPMRLLAPISARQDTDRKRIGTALGGQWESPEKTLLLTGQFLSTQATEGLDRNTRFETESGSSP